ncbi:MAG: hypothetical protein K2K25_02970, partial [Muribaculaceae bacterium]|nr:hypothetical protein [Muribaculaceae bacterium]
NTKKRLKEYLEYKNMSIREFERTCGLSNGLAMRLSTATNPSTLKKITTSCDINIKWLLSGEGTMIKKGVQNEVESLTPKEKASISDGLKSGKFRLVPLINIDSVGGVHSENAIDVSEQYVIKMMPFADALPDDVAILQSGNSMYPTIPSGSALLIREVKNWREYFGYGGIFVLLLSDGRRITKEVRRYEEDPKNYIWCVSYNPDVADEELPKSLIKGVWKVVKYIADFGW